MLPRARLPLARAARRPVRSAVALVVLLPLLAGCSELVEALLDGGAPTAGVDTDRAPDAATALALLATVEVRARDSGAGYDREGSFGEAWLDVDVDGCDTRNDILLRDLAVDRVEADGCTVLTGTLDDPYTGGTVRFERGWETSQAVQIDHVVALSNAWRTGAQRLSADERVAFANDPRNLLAVDGPTNAAKGNDDAAEWLPPDPAFHCTYVALQTRVKAEYGLWMTEAEHAAVERVLERCPA